MLWLALTLLHSAPARLPAPPVRAMVLADLDAGADDGGPADVDAGTEIGNQPGDGEPGGVGIPSRCTLSEDCPAQFTCYEHHCRPVSQKAPQSGGCMGGTGALGAAFSVLGLRLGRKRRPRA